MALGVTPEEAEEAELVARITEGFPQGFWERYRALVALRDAETLTEDEYEELLACSDRVEEKTARRATDLVRLATLRGLPLCGATLDALIEEFDIRPIRLS
jgi:hypothetical protein